DRVTRPGGTGGGQGRRGAGRHGRPAPRGRARGAEGSDASDATATPPSREGATLGVRGAKRDPAHRRQAGGQPPAEVPPAPCGAAPDPGPRHQTSLHNVPNSGGQGRWAKQEIVNDPQAKRMMYRPQRHPYHL
nr:hypothetical protein [Planctomycetota bacterium]